VERGAASAALAELVADVPDDLVRQALTHASWTARRTQSYGRLAFLGDSVLGLAVANELFGRFPEDDIGRLTKIHNQAVSGSSCAEVARRLDLPRRLREVAADAGGVGLSVEGLLASERGLASVSEAIIGACYIVHGFDRTAGAVVAAFEPEIELALRSPVDFKSALQEVLASRGSRVTYEVVREAGPAHERRFEVVAKVDDEVVGSGGGRSKKAAEQEAAEQALKKMGG
jgi:ribonuclease-3